MRGTRRLSDIAGLSRAVPLRLYAASVAEATLSEIESGKAMPSLATLHALSLVYKTSMSHLMSFVVEEKLAASDAASGSSLDDAEREFGRLLRAGDWYAALAIAHEWEVRSTKPGQHLAWRGNRASCLSRIGLHDEAISILSGCVESPGITLVQRFWFMRALADCQIQAGHFSLAAMLLKELSPLLEQVGLDEEQLAELQVLRAYALLESREAGISSSDATTREALRILDAAEKRVADGAPVLRLQLLQADGHAQAGNLLLAMSRIESVLARARAMKLSHVEAQAAHALGCVLKARGDSEGAIRHLKDAVSLARAGRQHAVEFKASLELFQLLRDEHPGAATRSLRRCREIYPLLPERSTSVRHFESIVRSLA